MKYAFIFGGDCNRWDISQFLSHPDSHFFKVIHGDRWCGYAAVLEVECAGYGRGLLIDVFSVDTSASLPWLDLYRAFVDYCAQAAVRHGFNCVLIPDEKLRISSHHNICGPVLEYFSNCEKIGAGGCVMREPVLNFQSLQTGYLVTWKRDE